MADTTSPTITETDYVGRRRRARTAEAGEVRVMADTTSPTITETDYVGYRRRTRTAEAGGGTGNG